VEIGALYLDTGALYRGLTVIALSVSACAPGHVAWLCTELCPIRENGDLKAELTSYFDTV